MFALRSWWVLGLLVGACGGSAAVRQGDVSSVTAAIRAAEEVGAQQNPKSALYLKYARDQLAQARALLDKGEDEQASLLLLRSEADAELAVATARSIAARREASAAADEVTALKSGTGESE